MCICAIFASEPTTDCVYWALRGRRVYVRRYISGNHLLGWFIVDMCQMVLTSNFSEGKLHPSSLGTPALLHKLLWEEEACGVQFIIVEKDSKKTGCVGISGYSAAHSLWIIVIVFSSVIVENQQENKQNSDVFKDWKWNCKMSLNCKCHEILKCQIFICHVRLMVQYMIFSPTRYPHLKIYRVLLVARTLSWFALKLQDVYFTLQ